MEIRKAFDRTRHQTPIRGESLTHQAMAKECDINSIMAKWQKTGIIEHRNEHQGQYGDYTVITSDYQEALNAVLAADEMFSSLPANVRKKFDNDPGQFIEYASDPKNAQGMVKLGLATETILETQKAPDGAKKPLSERAKADKPAPKTDDEED